MSLRLNLLPGRSLTTRVTLFTLVIFVLGLWSLAYYASRMLHRDMQRMQGEHQFSTAALIAADVDRKLELRLHTLEKMAAQCTPSRLRDASGLQDFLTRSELLQSLFNGGAFITAGDAMVLAAAPQSAERAGTSVAERDYMIAALKQGKASIGRPMLTPPASMPVLAMAAPIRDAQDQVIGALVGLTRLDLPNFLDQIEAHRYGKTGSYLLIAPQHRLIVTASDRSHAMQMLPTPGSNPTLERFVEGYEGTQVFVDPYGAEVLTSIKRIPVAGWYAAVTLPTADAFAPIRSMEQRMLLATCLLTLIAEALMQVLLRRQLAPLRLAASTLSALSTEKQALHPLPITHDDEIGHLLGGFNRLLADLEQRKSLLRQIFDTSRVAIFLLDQQGRVRQANQHMADMFGCELDALIGSSYVSLPHPAERALARRNIEALLSNAVTSIEADRRYQRFDRSEFWGHLSSSRFTDARGQEDGIIGVITNITERKQAQDELQLAASVFTHAREGIMITATDGVIVDVNAAFSRITGFERDEVLGRTPRFLRSGRQSPAFYEAMWRDLTHRGQWDGEVWNRRKNGEIYPELLTISSVRNQDDQALNYVALFTDITAIKTQQVQLERLAHFDALTGLPNRVLLADRLHQAMMQAQRREQTVAVAYLDLDGFKTINDQHGHEIGDQLLMTVAARMKQALRESDTLARLGGDEFVAVLLDLSDTAASVPLLMRLLDAAAQAVLINGLPLQVSASIGVTFYPQASDIDADQLLRQADQAMYQAKLAGKNRFHLFDTQQDSSIRGHNEEIQQIREALAQQQFVLHYQPKVNMRSGLVIGAEALIRWQHPQRGLLPPAHFLPLIADDPLSIAVGDWVIDRVLAQMTQWQSAGFKLPVSINVGARELQQIDFTRRLGERLARHPMIRPHDLELEVLESSALDDLGHIARVIEECRQLGVSFALDDFGTGYSSLTYLKHLRVSLLKIDRSFVHNMLDDPDDLAILEGVIGLASAFRRQVIAEGVESAAHGSLLLQLGCELAQGFGIAAPMPASELPDWAARWRPDPAWADLPRVSYDNLPVLRAAVEYRAWLAGVEAFLKDQPGAPPPAHPQQLRLDSWLQGAALTRHGAQPAWQAIELLHHEALNLAARLLQLKSEGHTAQALAHLSDLRHLHQRLLAQLTELEQATRPSELS